MRVIPKEAAQLVIQVTDWLLVQNIITVKVRLFILVYISHPVGI